MNTALKAHITSLANGAGGNRQERLNNVLQALSFFEWCTESQAINPVAATYYSLFRLFNVYHEGSNDSSKPTGTGDVSEDDEEFDENREVELNSWIVEFISTTCSDAPITSLDVGVFNAAFDYFYRHGDADGALALFNLMAKRGLPPDDSTLGLIFATCANSDQNEVGLKFLEHAMNQVDFKPSLNVLNGAIQMCANSNNPDGAVELFRAIESADAYGPTVDTYEQVVRAYARVGDIASAWGIANEMERSLNKVPTGIYNRVMQACAVAGSPERALEMLDRMRCSNGVAPPDVVSYNMALKAVVVSGVHEGEDDDDDEDEADLDENGSYRDLDREGNESTDENVEWNGKLESGDVKDQDTLEDDTDEGYELERRERSLWTRTIVVDLVEEMCRSRRSKPDEVTYERAIAACSAYEDPEGVVIIFDKLIGRKKGGKARVLKHHLVSDDSISGYLEACRSLKEKERVTEASSLLHQWHLASSQPLSLNVVTQLLDALEDIGEWRCAVRMIPEMQELFGVAPSVVLFNRAMQMCNSAGEHQLVAPIFVTMQDASAYLVFPDVESYIQRIYAEEQREDWVTATDLFVEMQKKCRSEDISHKQLQKIALGRYSLRQKNC
ncbi:hypothetical protein PHYBOEH_002212 [Phytophthora boehmeriae]|uniref:PROP1-like PPR domain-containing protein n=1 Tax=Phytophthora boehmeriae TaxID=109152 RepID=A0A8T1WSP1_9STRA|nr:hypothetical protein PHYBOEH_002212 [Phytophthora boehmeriae]